MIKEAFLMAFLNYAAVAEVKQCCPKGVLFNESESACSDGTDIVLNCTDGYVHFYVNDPNEEPDSVIDTTGVISLSSYAESEYCLSKYVENWSSVPQTIAVACYDWEKFFTSVWSSFIILIVSFPFLIAIILVYSMIPSLRNLHGKCIIGYISSLLISYICLIVIYFAPEVSYWTCYVEGTIFYVLTISPYTWLNLVTFNLWRGVRNKMYQMSEKKVFYIQLLWSIGIPLLLSAIILIQDLTSERNTTGNFNVFECWFSESSDFWTWLSVPSIILVVLNFAMLLHCCWILCQGCKQVTQPRIREQRFRCLLIFKLFAVTGAPLIGEILVSVEFTDKMEYNLLIWNTIICVYALLLFVILVACHKKVLRAIHHHRLFGIKWPESWSKRDEDSSQVSDNVTVVMESIKENVT